VVNRARQGARGGETKSDPKDAAAVIAELARTRPALRPVEPASEVDAELRLLVARRRDLVVDQTRRASRIRELMLALLPALERRIDVTIRRPAPVTRFPGSKSGPYWTPIRGPDPVPVDRSSYRTVWTDGLRSQPMVFPC
jgi:hypothetical protein